MKANPASFLRDSIREENLSGVKFFLENLTSDNRGLSSDLLILAANYGHLEIIKYLVEKWNLDVRVYDNLPLITACYYGDLEIVKYLLSQNADVSVRNNYPLFLAVRNGHYDVVECLVQYGANPDHYRINNALNSISIQKREHSRIAVYLWQVQMGLWL